MAAWLLLLSKGNAVYISEALSYFRRHPNQNNNTMGLQAFSEWLDITIASREDGFLNTNELYRTALESYRGRVGDHHQFVGDIARIEMILATLD